MLFQTIIPSALVASTQPFNTERQQLLRLAKKAMINQISQAVSVVCSLGVPLASDLLFSTAAQSSMRVRHNHRCHGFLLLISVISSLFPPSQSFSNADFSPGFHAGRISEGQFEHPDLNGWMTAQEVEAYLVGVLQCESYRQF